MLPTLLLAAYSLGCPPAPPLVLPVDAPHAWEVEYGDGLVVPYSTPSWRLDFDERPHRSWRSRCAHVVPNWSPWSRWIQPQPYPGDANLDCTVGSPDWLAVAGHWGEVCP